MTSNELPGTMNGPALGIIVRALVRRVTDMARQRLSDFAVYDKPVAGRTGQDIVTSIDLRAQEMYVALLKECFPGYGIVGEEENLRVPCTNDQDIWFTVDPIDGTKALARRQSHGIATMVSLVHKGKVVASFIGDIMTGEVFYHRPGSIQVHRQMPTDNVQVTNLEPNNRALIDQRLLLRDNPLDLPEALQRLCLTTKNCSRVMFSDIEVTGGSIGCMFARLWKQEVGGLLLLAGQTTPWDLMPLIGPCRLLEYSWLQLQYETTDRLTAAGWTHIITPMKQHLPDLLVIPHGRVAEVLDRL